MIPVNEYEGDESLPTDFDPVAYYANHPMHILYPERRTPCLAEIFDRPIVGDGFLGDTLLDD
jgi:hypothetical protein